MTANPDELLATLEQKVDPAHAALVVVDVQNDFLADGGHYHRAGNDDYKQAGDLFRLMTAEERVRLIDNIVDSMKSVPRETQSRQIAHFYQADLAYGEGVEAGLKTVEPMAIG